MSIYLVLLISLSFATYLAISQGLTFRSGNGGYNQVSLNGTTWFTLTTAVWELNQDARLTENTHSGTGGSSNYEKVVKDNNWRLQLPWDEENIPESFGIVEGDKIYLRFKHGSGAILKQLTLTTVEHFKTTDDNAQDIVRCEIDGKGGVRT